MSRKGIMLCYPFEEKRLSKWNPPYIVQPKLDGIRCRAICVNGRYILLSSEENIIYLPHITDALNKEAYNLNYELDGEIYHHGWPLEQINGISSRTVNSHPDAHKLEFHVFDVVNDYDIQASRLVTLTRLRLSHPLISVPYAVATTLAEIMEHYRRFIDLGYEGIIVRHHAATYLRKRSTYIMKFKPKKSDVYQITGYKEEVSIEGIPKNTLGSLELWDGDNYFYAGAGLDHDTKRAYWKMRDELIGKYAKVTYQCLSGKLRVPKFIYDVEILEGGEDAQG